MDEARCQSPTLRTKSNARSSTLVRINKDDASGFKNVLHPFQRPRVHVAFSGLKPLDGRGGNFRSSGQFAHS